ncbi:MBL fold metallo-hydrolase [Halorussus amylolyticus]|uniref:MBL fold metallo-hydrolase n=1 Tax=Halorussus amylolyticus TaxID=1126242 RepID=UPI001049D7AB|nr:MBL fold metallo-hydrolase [Halorussus amylolyticus]
MASTTELREGEQAGVWWFDLGHVNAYLVEDGDDVVLVDAGTPRDADAIAAGIRDAGYAVGDVTRVLLTHFDVDHVGALGKLGFDAPVYVGREDAAVLAGQDRPDWRNHKGLLQRVTLPFVVAPGVPIRPVSDGDEIGGFTAYHTPGHSPGHVVYVGDDVAFLGDLVRERGGRLEPSPWHLSDDTTEVRRSVRAFADRAPDFEVAAMGHGTPILRNGGDRLRELADRV